MAPSAALAPGRRTRFGASAAHLADRGAQQDHRRGRAEAEHEGRTPPAGRRRGSSPRSAPPTGRRAPRRRASASASIRWAFCRRLLRRVERLAAVHDELARSRGRGRGRGPPTARRSARRGRRRPSAPGARRRSAARPTARASRPRPTSGSRLTVTSPSCTVIPSTRPSPSSSAHRPAVGPLDDASSRCPGPSRCRAPPSDAVRRRPRRRRRSPARSGPAGRAGLDVTTDSRSTALATRLGHVRGEGGLHLGFAEGVADQVGDRLGAQHRRLRPHGDDRDAQHEHRDDADDGGADRPPRAPAPAGRSSSRPAAASHVRAAARRRRPANRSSCRSLTRSLTSSRGAVIGAPAPRGVSTSVRPRRQRPRRRALAALNSASSSTPASCMSAKLCSFVIRSSPPAGAGRRWRRRWRRLLLRLQLGELRLHRRHLGLFACSSAAACALPCWLCTARHGGRRAGDHRRARHRADQPWSSHPSSHRSPFPRRGPGQRHASSGRPRGSRPPPHPGSASSAARTPPASTTASRSGFAHVCSNTRIAAELFGSSRGRQRLDVLVRHEPLDPVQQRRQRRRVVVGPDLRELDEGRRAVGVLRDEHPVDDRDRAVLHEPLQLGHDLAREPVLGEGDFESSIGPNGMRPSSVTPPRRGSGAVGGQQRSPRRDVILRARGRPAAPARPRARRSAASTAERRAMLRSTGRPKTNVGDAAEPLVARRRSASSTSTITRPMMKNQPRVTMAMPTAPYSSDACSKRFGR